MRVVHAAAVALAAALSVPAAAQTPRDTVVMAKQIDDIVSFDPAESFEASGLEATSNLYDKLINFDTKDLTALHAGLAQSWSAGADGRTYTIKIRPGVTFASGNPVTAQDAVYSIQRAVTLNKAPGFILTQFGFTGDNVLQRVRAVDDATLVIETEKAMAPSFLYYCLTSSVAAIVDSRIARANEKDGDFGNGWMRQNSAGSGAFVLRSWRPNEGYTMEANPTWFRGPAKTRRVVVRHVTEASTQRILLEKGDVDYARGLTKEHIDALRSNPDVAIDRGTKGHILYLALNLKHPVLGRPGVSEALKWLVDYDSIERNIVAGTLIPHQAFLPKGFFGGIDDRPYKFDLARGRELLARAGVPDGFAVTMDVRSTAPFTEIAQAIQATWAQAGIRLELLAADARQTATKFRARKHEIYISTWGPDYPDPHTNASVFAMNPDNSDDARDKTMAWRTSWDIPDMTRRTAAALEERDQEKRRAFYEDLQREHQRTSPFVIMFQLIETAAHRKNVDGYLIGPTADTNYFWNIAKN